MDGALFNPQDGKMLRERATSRGADTVQLADGRPLPATRYSLTGETQIDDWYDRDGVWAALRGKIKDGSVLTYQRLRPAGARLLDVHQGRAIGACAQKCPTKFAFCRVMDDPPCEEGGAAL